MDCLRQKTFLQFKRFVLGVSLAFMVLIAAGCGSPQPVLKEKSSSIGQVHVEIDFAGRQADKEFHVDCFEQSTVFSVLTAARETGEIEFRASGAGESAFLKSIDGVENEGASGDNWVFRVNGEIGDSSCGVYSVKPDDTIVWRIGSYAPEGGEPVR